MALEWHFLCHFPRDGTSSLPEHRRQFFCSSYKRYCSYLRFSYKLHHMQVPNGTKNGTVGVVSGTRTALLVSCMALERHFWCHVSSGKAGAIGRAELITMMFNGSFQSYCSYLGNVLFFTNFTLRKCDIALKTTRLVPLLKWKSSEVQKKYYCNSYVPEPLTGEIQEPFPYTPPPSPLNKFHKSSAHQ